MSVYRQVYSDTYRCTNTSEGEIHLIKRLLSGCFMFQWILPKYRSACKGSTVSLKWQYIRIARCLKNHLIQLSSILVNFMNTRDRSSQRQKNAYYMILFIQRRKAGETYPCSCKAAQWLSLVRNRDDEGLLEDWKCSASWSGCCSTRPWTWPTL